MTAAKIDNQLYYVLKGRVSNALDLEYAIRAAEQLYPEQMSAARALQNDVYVYWRGEGFSQEEILEALLLDVSLDSLQFGAPTTARRGGGGRKVAAVIGAGLEHFRARFSARSGELQFPASRFFRACDLLAGNDIGALFEIVQAKLEVAASGKYKPTTKVPIEEFDFPVREPFHVHPNFRFGMNRDGKPYVGIQIDLEGDFDMQDWERQISQFQFLFAKLRRDQRPRTRESDVSDDLIRGYAEARIDPSHSEFPLAGRKSFLAKLAGLYCWDLRFRAPSPLQLDLATAVEQALALYTPSEDPNGGPTVDSVTKNCRDAGNQIKKVKQRFQAA